MKYFLLFIIFISSCYTSSKQVKQNTTIVEIEKSNLSEEFTSDISEHSKVNSSFSSINQKLYDFKLKRLQETQLDKDDVEIRLWINSGLSAGQGIIIKRTNRIWSGKHLYYDFISERWINKIEPLKTPKSGWKETWIKLLKQKILVLPDAKKIDCKTMLVLDGTSFVFEIMKGVKYRTYAYGNPEIIADECSEARLALNIVEIFFDEFQI